MVIKHLPQQPAVCTLDVRLKRRSHCAHRVHLSVVLQLIKSNDSVHSTHAQPQRCACMLWMASLLSNSLIWLLPSLLWRCWLGGRKGIRPVKTEWWGAGMVICLEQVVDLDMAQLMPLPLTVSCFRKIPIGFTFLVPAHLGSPGKRAIKCVCDYYRHGTMTTTSPCIVAMSSSSEWHSYIAVGLSQQWRVVSIVYMPELCGVISGIGTDADNSIRYRASVTNTVSV